MILLLLAATAADPTPAAGLTAMQALMDCHEDAVTRYSVLDETAEAVAGVVRERCAAEERALGDNILIALRALHPEASDEDMRPSVDYGLAEKYRLKLPKMVMDARLAQRTR